MKTATVELEAGGVGCHGQFVNLDLRWFLVLWLRVGEKRHTKFFFVKGGSVMVHRRRCGGGARRCQLHLRGARTTEKKIWWAKKGGSPTFPHLPGPQIDDG